MEGGRVGERKGKGEEGKGGRRRKGGGVREGREGVGEKGD